MILSLIVLLTSLACINGASLNITSINVIGAGGTTSTSGLALSVLSSGNYVLSGSTTGSIAAPLVGSANGFIRSYSADGTTILWSRQVYVTGGTGVAGVLATATDPDDNIYASSRCIGSFYGGTFAGTTTTDVCVVKYDKDGQRKFAVQTGSTLADQPLTIAVNQADRSFWVAGLTRSPSWDDQPLIGTADGYLVKFSSSGVKQGVYRFGVAGTDTVFYSTTVDSLGNLWTAGYTLAANYYGAPNSRGSSGLADIIVQKTNSTGHLQFARLIGGPTDHDVGYAIVLDSDNNGYVVGESNAAFDGHASAGSFDISVAKYDSSGNKVWSALHGGTGRDRASATVFDNTNNYIYVTGYTTSPVFYGQANPITTPTDTGSAFLLVLSPADGSVLSARVFSGSAASPASAIATNGAFVYIAGSTSGIYQGKTISGTQGAFALKIAGYNNALGAVKVIDMGGTASTGGARVAAHSSGSFVTVAYTIPASGSTYNTIRKYSPDGVTVMWSQQVTNSANTGGYAIYVSSAIDPDDNTYVVMPCTGTFFGAAPLGNYDICVVKYDADGNRKFTLLAGDVGAQIPYAIAVNQVERSFWVAGATNSENPFDGKPQIGNWDGFLVKFSPSGVKQAVYRYGVASTTTFFYATALDNSGNSWTTGYFYGASTYYGAPYYGAGVNMLVQKTDDNGQIIFSALIGGSSDVVGQAIEVDASSNGYVAGYAEGGLIGTSSLGNRDITVAKFNSAGVKQWSVLRGGAGRDIAYGIVYDNTNNYLYVTGSTASSVFHGASNSFTSGTGSAFLLVLSPVDGSVVLARVYAGSAASTGNAVATNGAFMFLAGVTSGTFQGQTITGTQGAFTLKIAGYGGPRACVQWALGDVGESCSATCGRLSRVCKVSYFTTLSSQETFYDMIASTVSATSNQALGEPYQLCSLGPNGAPDVGVPAVAKLAFVDNGSSAVRTSCSYPTSPLRSDELRCDAVVTTAPANRFCPCVDNTCDAPAAPITADPAWYLGESGDSCDATCVAADNRYCVAEPLSTIKTNADFQAVVTASRNIDGSAVTLNPAVPFCSAGSVNSLIFADYPAALSYIAPGGAANQTLCTFPIVSQTLNSACSASAPSVRRFCSCKSYAPTAQPTAVPTASPSAVPTVKPTANPSAAPTASPSAVPTVNPTAKPTAVPTAKPSAFPTAAPTAVPSAKPSAKPTASPSAAPTFVPTAVPSAAPSASPSAKPSASPTASPSAVPTVKPTAIPTALPTVKPTAKPTANPSAAPSAAPTTKPTATPTRAPTFVLTARPSVTPIPYAVSTTVMVGTTLFTTVSSIIALASGDVVVAGLTKDTLGAAKVSSGDDIYVRRYGDSTSYPWIAYPWTYQNGGSYDSSPPALAKDAADKTYLTYRPQAGTAATASLYPVTATTLNSNTGSVGGYTNSYVDATGRPYGQSYAIVTDSVRNVTYVVGERADGSSATAAFIAKYNSVTGALVYYKTNPQGSPGGSSSYRAVAIDSTGAPWVVGYNQQPGLRYITYLQRLDSTGTADITVAYGSYADKTGGYGLAIDASDNVYYVAGSPLDDVAVVKFNSFGAQQWVKEFGVSGTVDKGYALAVDSSNNVLYVTGYTQSTSFAGLSNPGGPTAAFLVSLRLSDGAQQYAQLYTNGVGQAIAVSTDSIYVAGYAIGQFQGEEVTGGTTKGFYMRLYRPTVAARRLNEKLPALDGAVLLESAASVSMWVYAAGVMVAVGAAAMLVGTVLSAKGHKSVVVLSAV